MKKKKSRRWVKSWKGRLGPLQTEMMHLIFRYGKDGIPAGDVFEILSEEQSLPKSSVYTVLNRLITRGILERKKVDGIYHYCPLIEEKDLGRFGSYEDKMYKKGTIDLISRLIQREIARNPEEIEKLQKLLDEERSKLGQKQS
ncbi:BlaI/MecI/CopY family transcriptional regulator [Candidatus Aerophobetes bacterium]|nr:BlaI/MecI/CopY family transcriptional regulator [Candidatus Aerophobetes bacterium]